MGPLRILIHRGADEIGGNCVELICGEAHLIVDMGRPLGAKPGEVVPVPPIPGLAEADPRLAGVVLSHPHEDHVGQVRALGAHVPVYLGAAAERILREATRWTPTGLDVRAAGYLEHRRPIQIGPFTVTPYLVDHSAYDAYALLIEAGGQRVFYSGDLRAHGRTGRFADLLRDGPRGVDLLLLEGTHVAPVGAHPTRGPSERDVEGACLATFRNAPGIAVTCFSAQNIDRLVSIYRAARRAGRELVLDLYTASIAIATGRSSIPQPGFEGLRVYVRNHERRTVIAQGAFDRVDAVRACRIFPEELASRRRELVIVGRDSVIPELDRAGILTDATFVWSMWKGYLRDAGPRSVATFAAQRGLPLVHHHASGHASVDDLRRLVAALRPRRVVPIHTVAPDAMLAALASPERTREVA